MRIIIYYKSVFGSTKRYANWLNQLVESDIYKFRDISKNVISKSQIVVVMSGTYAGQMPLINFLKSNWDILKTKKVIVIAVGAAPKKDKQSKISYDLIPDEIKENIQYFKLPGKLLNPDKDTVKEDNLLPIIKLINKIK